MEKDWRRVFSTLMLHDAEMVKAILEDNGIPAVVINKMDSMNQFLTNAPAEVWVNEQQEEDAKKLIEESGI
ncbi:MAG: DUF2007 domain-containing protein [Bacteroidetes bacterium]|nr:DUF2007 domain-containing protein [Bacteroidota bacterium]MBU1717833.1 DUF2007 domain-containing protein [Bacteroidota bacterium]